MSEGGGVYTTFCQEEGVLWQKYAIEMGGVSRYFSKVSGSEVDLTLLSSRALFQKEIVGLALLATVTMCCAHVLLGVAC